MISSLSSHPTLTPKLTTTLSGSSDSSPSSTPFPTPSLTIARSLPQLPTKTIATLSPLDLFLHQFLHSTHVETRVDAMRRCFVVANAIGCEETIHTLIPLLGDHICFRGSGVNPSNAPTAASVQPGGNPSTDRSSSGNNLSSNPSSSNAPPNNSVVPTRIEEEDEILLILAEQLGQMVVSGLVPGYRSLGILNILEKLAMVEETVVRDRAVLSLHCIIPLVASAVPTATRTLDKEEEDALKKCVKIGPGILVNMVKRLASGEWFTAKVSACSVLPSVYQFLNRMKTTASILTGTLTETGGVEATGGAGTTTSVEETKRQLRAIFKALSEEDSPMIRRGAGKNLGRYAEAVANLTDAPQPLTEPSSPATKDADDDRIALGLSVPASKNFVLPGGKDEAMIKKMVGVDLKNRVMEEVVPVFQALANDEQDSVRSLAVASSGSMGCALGLDADLCAKAVLPIVGAGSIDLSWRVRHNLAKEFSVVAQSQGFHESTHSKRLTELFQFFSNLLQDFEAEVRTSSVENLARMAQLGGVDLFTSHLAPVLPSLADDPVMEVRSKLAETLMDCCDPSICTTLNDKIILQDFKPLLEGFLNDEFADVQLHILSKLSRVTHLLDKMDAVVESILSMTKAPNWRVREAVCKLLPHLAEARGVTFFENNLLDPWTKLLLDQVADVRSACVEGMPKLLSVAGAEWIERSILPLYARIYTDSTSYLTRVSVLRSYSKFVNAETGMTPGLMEAIVGVLVRALEEDKVANVRIVAAKGLGEVAHGVEEGMMSAKILPALQNRASDDDDVDCQFFAQAALEACEACSG